MPIPDDADLLARYARHGDEGAFAELVRRRIGLVYAVALRRAGRAALAQDAAQVVFASAARHAERLARHPALAGWFYRAAYNAATDLLRAEIARTRREQESHTMLEDAKTGSAEPDWENLRPLIDTTMQQLPEPDRAALVLRFFDDCTFAAIGEQLKITENTARMRTQRALEKLRGLLARRGVTSTGAALATALARQAAASVPAGMAETVASASLAAAGAAGPLSAGLGLTLFTMNLTKIAGLTAALLAIGGLGYWAGHREPSTASPSGVTYTSTAEAVVKSGADVPAAASAGTALSQAALAQNPGLSPLAQGEWTPVSALGNRGRATPRAAYETLKWAQSGGDVAAVEATIYLTPKAIKQAELFLSELPPELRSQYRTPHQLIATYLVGGLPHKPQDDVLQLTGEETGTREYPELLYGLPASTLDDPNYVMLRGKVRYPKKGEGGDNAVFFRSDDGWRWLVTPGLIDWFRREQKKLAAAAAAGIPGVK